MMGGQEDEAPASNTNSPLTVLLRTSEEGERGRGRDEDNQAECTVPPSPRAC